MSNARANSSAASLDAQPPAVAGSVSVPTAGGFFLDWPGGGRDWESLTAREFPAHLAEGSAPI